MFSSYLRGGKNRHSPEFTSPHVRVKAETFKCSFSPSANKMQKNQFEPTLHEISWLDQDTRFAQIRASAGKISVTLRNRKNLIVLAQATFCSRSLFLGGRDAPELSASEGRGTEDRTLACLVQDGVVHSN